MHTEIHIGFKWVFTAENMTEIEKIAISRYGMEDHPTLSCGNGHEQADGAYCMTCGTALSKKVIKRPIKDFEYWEAFDGEGFYINENVFYYSTQGGCFSEILAEDLEMEIPDDEFSQILNSFQKPIPCAFIVPWIYENQGDDDHDS